MHYCTRITTLRNTTRLLALYAGANSDSQVLPIDALQVVYVLDVRGIKYQFCTHFSIKLLWFGPDLDLTVSIISVTGSPSHGLLPHLHT